MDDVIKVTLDDGSELEYRVTVNVAIPYDDPDVLKLMGRTTKDAVTLITCGGTSESDPEARYGGNYSDRVHCAGGEGSASPSRSPGGA